MERAFTVSV